MLNKSVEELLQLSSNNHLLLLPEYNERLNKELKLIKDLKLEGNIIFAYHIKEVIKSFNVPFFIRGSAGGSLLLFLLEFTTIDPIKNNILFERFINEYRDTLGDIDFDLPRSLRDNIMFMVWQHFYIKDVELGRLCTRVYYQENSAIREVVRKNFNFRHTIPKHIMENKNKLNTFLIKQHINPEEVYCKAKKLEGTLRYTSTHVGGITVLNEGEKTIEKDHYVIPMINLDKNDIDKQKRFKVDLLSNTGLDIITQVYKCKSLDEKTFPYNQKVFDMIGEGDIIGIVLGESPLIKNIFKIYHQKNKIKSISDIAKCLSLIRPMARGNGKDSDLIFDDDWILELSKLMNISYSQADFQRRKLSKDDPNILKTLKSMVSPMRLKQLMQIKQYGFCKAHAYNYAQLIYCQAYAKWEKPVEFFCAVLNTLSDRMYADWVYFLDAVKKGIKIFANKKRDVYIVKEDKKGNKYIQPKSGIQMRLFPLKPEQEVHQFNGLTSLKGIETLNGKEACSRVWKDCLFRTVHYNGELVDEFNYIYMK